MKNREFDDKIRQLFENFRDDSALPDWEDMDRILDDNRMSEHEPEPLDQEVKDLFDGFVPADATPQWDRMSQTLDELEDKGFDEEIKEKVQEFEAPYDASSWPVLSDKLLTREWLHRHIVTIKVLEVVAVLLLFVSFYNISSHVLPQENRETNTTSEPVAQILGQEDIFSPGDRHAKVQNGTQSQVAKAENTQGESGHTRTVHHGVIPSTNAENAQGMPPASLIKNGEFALSGVNEKGMIPAPHSIVWGHSRQTTEPGIILLHSELNYLESNRAFASLTTTPTLKQKEQTKVFFGVSSGSDINSLLIPEDYFFTLGQAFKFTDKTLIASGYSAGTSLSFERQRFGFETGLYYASKDYEPDRILYIAEDVDKSTLDFQSISLDIVSVPAHIKYRIDPVGKWRLYVLGGVEMHVLAAADYDLITRNSFASIAPPGEGAGRSNFFEEVQRVRERILEGAEFKSNSFFTANAALGLERSLNTRYSAFFQPTYQHQLSTLSATAEENGKKELKSLSFRLGVRTRLK